MKRAFLTLIVILNILLLLNFNSCQKLESVTPPPVSPDADMATAPAKDDQQEELTASQKWQQMIATDINTLQMSKTSDKAGKVYVVSFHPQGQTRNTSAVDEINITFSEPVAPLKKAVKNEPSLIKTKPFLKGEGYWKSSTTYTYRIDEKLKLSTRYTVRFKGYKSFNGKPIDDKSWSFNTPTIKILRTKPYHGTRWQTREQRVLVRFSQDVDLAKISPYIYVFTPEGTHPFNVRYSTEEERKMLYYWSEKELQAKQFVTVIPAAQYPIASSIRVGFKTGLPSMSGNIGLLRARELSFRTFEVFDITSVSSKFNPDQGILVKFTNPVQVKHFKEKISFEPAVDVHKGGTWNSSEITVNGKFTPGVTYTMTVPADLTDQFGNQLGTEKKYTIECVDFTPYLYPPGPSHFIFENFLDKRLWVNVRNVYETPVSYKKLDKMDLLKLPKNNYPSPGYVTVDNVKDFQWKLPIKKNRNYTLGFNLEEIGIKDPGYYYINFGKTTRSYYLGHIFQMTDIALVAKYSPSQILMVPFNLKTGELVPQLDFSIENLDKDQVIARSAKGDKNGVAIFEPDQEFLKSNRLLDFKLFSEPHKGFLWGLKYEMLDMWNFEYEYHVDYNYQPSYFYYHLMSFTDKHLYKGGQTVKFKSIVREILAGKMVIPHVKQINVEVFNSRSQSIHKYEIDGAQVTAYGSFASQFQLPADAPTGFYRIHIKAIMEKGDIDRNLMFSVQEYKPAKFEVKVSLDQSSIISGQTVSGKINGRYLFGTPMKQAAGNTAWTIQSSSYSPPGWDAYSFGTYDSHHRNTIMRKDFTLDDQGNYNFTKEGVTAPGKNSARLTVHGEIKDKDNNRIASSRSLLVHRGEFYIGLKSGSYFFKANQPGTIQLVTVSPDGKPFFNTAVNLKIVREEWKSFQQKDASGALRWNWKKITHDVVDQEITLPKGAIEKEFTFKDPGYYRVYVTGKDSLENIVTTSGYFYVTGSGYVSWGVNEGRVIDLVTDKNSYKPGDHIELLIKSPFETSTALITVEREKVMWHKTVRLQGNASTVDIPVSNEFMPNAYINVIILKERTGLKWDEEGNDIGKPEFYAGYKAIKVDASQKKLNIDIKSNRPNYEPGEQVELDIQVTDASGTPVTSEVCISVVDKGVLNLVGYQLPDPFDYFWSNRPLDVKTVSTLSDVLGRRQFKEKGENPGGDGGGSAFGSVVVRKNFKESAYYTAFVETDAKGKAHISFKLPDNLTTFKAMAVAGSKAHQFGRGSRDLLVKKSIMLKPAVPNFSRPGDTYSAGVTVTNNSDKKMKIAVEVKAQDVERVKGDKYVKKISLTPGQTEAVWFKFKVNGVKTQKLTFKAVSGRFSDGLYQEIPVRIPQFVEAAANFGRVDEKPVKEQIIVPDGTLRELDKAEITLASSAMVGVKRNFDVLQEYPYDCLEQRISKQYPLLGAGEFLLTYGLLDMKKEQMDARISTLLKLMPQYQSSSGGFKYYPNSFHYSSYLSCYATEFILTAKKKGFKPDAKMVRDAIKFLKTVASRTVDFKYPYSKNISLLVQSYAVYVLSMDNVFMKDAINNLFEVRDRLPFPALAYLVKALDLKNDMPGYLQRVLAKTMINKMKDEPTMTHFENNEDDSWWWVHGSSVKTTAIVLDTFLQVYQRFPYAEKIARWLTNTTNQKRFLSTQEHLRMFMAFEHYFRVFEKETPDFVAKVLFNGTVKVKESFQGRELTARTHNLPLQDYKPGQTIDTLFEKEGTGMLYYLLRLKYYPIGEVEAIDRGFAVEKSYTTLDGTPVTDNIFKAGEKYIVTVKVKTSMERPFVMLDDPLPAGLRVLNPSFKTGMQLDMENSSRDSSWKGYWGNFYRSEIYFDRVQVFADFLQRGTHTWKYLAIATNAGSYSVPNTVVSEMYNPEVFGRSQNLRVQVK